MKAWYNQIHVYDGDDFTHDGVCMYFINSAGQRERGLEMSWDRLFITSREILPPKPSYDPKLEDIFFKEVREAVDRVRRCKQRLFALFCRPQGSSPGHHRLSNAAFLVTYGDDFCSHVILLVNCCSLSVCFYCVWIDKLNVCIAFVSVNRNQFFD